MCLSVYLPLTLSLCFCVRLSVYVYVCPSVRPPVRPSVRPSVGQTTFCLCDHAITIRLMSLFPDHDVTCYVIVTRKLPQMLCHCVQTIISQVMSL